MTTKPIRAPWTADQVTALNAFQHYGRMHPFTCGALHESGQSPMLVATHSGWTCPDPQCTFQQDWAHAFMIERGAAAVPVPPPADQTALRDRIRRAICEAEGFAWDTDMLEPDEYGDVADAVLAVLPEQTDRAALLRWAADRLTEDASKGAKEGWTRIYQRAAATKLRIWAGQEQPAETQATDRVAIIAELLPAWEAVYEPGNVSDYLIGYANDQDAATGMAEAWMRSQAEVTGRLEWTPWGTATAMPDGYDAWFELVERHDDGIDTGPGIIVRRRIEPAVGGQPETQEEAPVLPCNWAHTLHEHTPHQWEPQPGMDPVHCPGYDRAPE